MTVAVAITYPGAVGVGCPGNTTNWVLKPSGSLGNPTTFRRWRNDDGLDVELIASVNGSNNFVAQYVRVWKTTGEEVIADKSSGTWKVSGNCVNYTPPCNFIITIGVQRFVCLRPAVNAPYSCTLTGSGITDYAFGASNCGGNNVDFANDSHTFNLSSYNTYADGLVAINGGSITPTSPNPLCSFGYGQSFSIAQQTSGPSVSGLGNGCSIPQFDTPSNLCQGAGSGTLSLVTNSTQGWDEPFNQTVPLNRATGGPAGPNGTMNVSIP